ncbi:MAG: hypothetical protein ABI333_04730 [bacterium]
MTTAPRGSLTAALLRELLATPALKDLIKVGLSEDAQADPDEVVRTLVWGDTDLTMSVASTLPRRINDAVRALLSLGRQLDQLPDPLLAAFLDNQMVAVDTAALRELAAVGAQLARRLLRLRSREGLAALAGTLLAPALEAYNALLDRDPGLVARHLDEVLAPVPPEALRRALERTLQQLAETLSSRPELVQPLANFVATVLLHTVNTTLRNTMSSLGGRFRR